MSSEPTYHPNSTPFQVKIQVSPADIDEMDHVNNVVYLQWVQQVATAHWLAMASPEIRDNYRWVVLRHEIDYFNAAFLGDEILADTWVSTAEGAQSMRHVRFMVGEKKIAEAKTSWCLIDAKSLKPRRIGQDIKDLLQK
ncbi:MAG: acyl-CoA thioesterase [Bacteroidetes bacterium]|nr:acyl-CoA thioesterase [Bacteroidota bacterium]